MRKEFVEKIKEWPTPTTIRELNTWLGFTGYYRDFQKDYSTLTTEMNAQRKALKLDLTSVMENKFQMLKNQFKASPIRSYPMYSLDTKFILTTDYSQENLGAVLSQE